VRSALHRLGYRFRLHVRIPLNVGGTSSASPHTTPTLKKSARRTPRAVSVDILLPKHKTAIFVHGCFWHRHKGCKNCTTPTNRREWWLEKLNGNSARDLLHQAALKKLGWRVIVIWECNVETQRTTDLLKKFSEV